jgi:hypothetical protein
MGFPVLLGQAPHMILGYTTVPSLIVLKNNMYSHSPKAYCCFIQSHRKVTGRQTVPPEISYSIGSVSVLCGSQGISDQFPGDLWIHFCNDYFEVHLSFN